MTNKILPDWENHKDAVYKVAPGIKGIRVVFVNLYFLSDNDTSGGPWLLVDAGLWGSAGRIKKLAEERFGKGTKPEAIILTHGHFDHIGALKDLLREWDVPVYAHPLEIPYLTGQSSYPPPDPTVGGGGMAYMSWLYPKQPIDISSNIRTLPEDGTVPGLKGWHWVHTPGHTAGHVSFFRDRDHTLIAGDAFVTVNQESVYAVMRQKQEIHGPPAYFTSDWVAARESVQTLAALRPLIVATGHGMPMHGAAMQFSLQALAQNFEEHALPSSGRYVHKAALTNEKGVVALPPDPLPRQLAGVGLAAVAGAAIGMLLMRGRNAKKTDST
jgi:glyoxylase-like metal-dependent hydrolase (beta-lactamase superfamily II)